MLRATLGVCILAPVFMVSTPARCEIVGVFDPTGAPIMTRLFENSGVDVSAADPSRWNYIGFTAEFAQAGLFDTLTIRGDAGTSLTLGPGIVLSSGSVTQLPASNTVGWYSWVTNTGGNNHFRDFPAQTGTSRHGGRLDERDENSMTFDLDVPEGIQGLRAEFVYASEEFPEWSGTQYADGFAFFVDDVNYARLPDGRPVSLLRQDDNIHFMANGDSFDTSIPGVCDLEYDGVTRVLELTAPLTPGQRNTITIVVADTGDEIYDSAVFLTGFVFIEGDSPIPPEDCSVRVRHRSADDDEFIEIGSLAPPLCPGDADASGTIDFADVTSVLASFGIVYATTGPGDADINGSVEFADITAVLTSFGMTCP